MSRCRKVYLIPLVSLLAFLFISIFNSQSTSLILNSDKYGYFRGIKKDSSLLMRSGALDNLKYEEEKLDEEIQQLIDSLDRIEKNNNAPNENDDGHNPDKSKLRTVIESSQDELDSINRDSFISDTKETIKHKGVNASHNKSYRKRDNLHTQKLIKPESRLFKGDTGQFIQISKNGKETKKVLNELSFWEANSVKDYIRKKVMKNAPNLKSRSKFIPPQHQVGNTGKTNRTFDIILNPNTCFSRNLTLVMCVEISRDNFKGRQTIRQTWGSYGTVKDGPVALVFFLGAAKPEEDPDVQTEIEEEFKQFNDIVMSSFIDDYKNLTLKSLSIIRWVTEFCESSEYILKADDDVFINVPFLEYVLKNISRHLDNKPFIVGTRLDGIRPNRHMNHKWYVSSQEFRGNYYPPYVNGGGGYAMTSTAAVKIHEIASFVPFISMEDIFITGLCSRRASIKLLDEPRFSSHKLKVSGLRFLYQISGGNYSPDEIRTIHAEWVKLSPVRSGYDKLIGKTQEEFSETYMQMMRQEIDHSESSPVQS